MVTLRQRNTILNWMNGHWNRLTTQITKVSNTTNIKIVSKSTRAMRKCPGTTQKSREIQPDDTGAMRKQNGFLFCGVPGRLLALGRWNTFESIFTTRTAVILRQILGAYSTTRFHDNRSLSLSKELFQFTLDPSHQLATTTLSASLILPLLSALDCVPSLHFSVQLPCPRLP
jgi:hypothetical protein